MASNHKNAFPHFESNQILRSSTLNNYFAFLDEQTRLSRVHLFGVGVLEGLDFSLVDGVLVINPGVAVNKDGWLIQIPEKTEYRYAVEVVFSTVDFKEDELKKLASFGGSHISMICFRDEEDASHAGLEQPFKISDRDLDGYVVALAYGKRPEYDSRCTHDLCDVNTSPQILEAWPVLIPKKDILSLYQRITPISMSLPPQKEPAIEYYHGSVQVFNEQISASIHSWQAMAAEGLRRLSDEFKSFDSAALVHLFSGDKSLNARFEKARSRICGEITGMDLSLSDFFISFFRDVTMALSEFVEEYNSFADKYEYIPNNVPSDYLTYLGLFGGKETDKDVFKSIFSFANQEEFRKDSRRLRAMLLRICALSEALMKSNSTAWMNVKPFRVDKMRTGGRLSSRPIPFYYSIGQDFYTFWNADNHNLDYKQSVQDRFRNLYESMCDDGMSFYPSAYQGKDLVTVKNELDALNRELRLSIDVVEARLTQVEYLTEGQASVLLSCLEAICKKGATNKFFDSVREKCSEGASRLAGLLKDAFDENLIHALANAIPLSNEKYRKRSELSKVDDEDVAELAGKINQELSGKSTGAFGSDLSTYLSGLFNAWKGSIIDVAETDMLDEIGRAVSLAPIKRGCRVFVFTSDMGQGGSDRKVISYSVLYRNHSESVAKTNAWIVFRVRTKGTGSGDNASDLPDTINPYEDGRWDVSQQNEIVLYPYLLDGSGSKRYEMEKSDLECEVSSEKGILKETVKVENNVPKITLQMVENGTAWVTLRVKDSKGAFLYHKTHTININNPVWNIVQLTSLTISPKVFEQYLNDSPRQLVCSPTPKDATNGDKVNWSSNASKIAMVGNTGLVTAVKEGTTEIVVKSQDYPKVTQSCTVHVCSIFFRMKDADGNFQDLEKNATVKPFESGTSKKSIRWAVTENKMTICPFKYDGSKKTEFIPNPDGSENCRVTCQIDKDNILTYNSVNIGPNHTTPAIELVMHRKTGTAMVTLSFYKGTKMIAENKIKVVIVNAEWDRIPVESITLDPMSVALYAGQVKEMKYTVYPLNATTKEVFWTPRDRKIADVVTENNRVMVKAISAGSTSISVETKDGGKTKTASVKVSSLFFRVELKSPVKKDKYENVQNVISMDGDRYAGGSYVKVYPFVDDGSNSPRKLTSKEVKLKDDPALTAKGGAKITWRDDEDGYYARIPWKGSTAYIAICDVESEEVLYKQSFEIKV